MVRNIAVLSGSSHPAFVDSLCAILGVPPASRVLTKFSSGETCCEIRDSVRGKDVYIVQTFGVGPGSEREGEVKGDDDDGGGRGGGGYTVNDYFVELCIMISACKTGSAKRVTAVLPLFPYSRQPDFSFSKAGAPLVRGSGRDSVRLDASGARAGRGTRGVEYTFESVPVTPGPNVPRTIGLGNGEVDLADRMERARLADGKGEASQQQQPPPPPPPPPPQNSYTTHDYENPTFMMALQARSGHKQWMAQSGSLVADLLTCAGADRILTCDLHEPAYQGFFDIPVDNLHARPLLIRYIQRNIPNWRDAVIVSPDAGGAKRAKAIAETLGLAIALIHKERRPPKIDHPQKSTMMLVGDVAGRVCILIDDLVDTGNTITRAAKLLRREGASRVVALLTHGVLSGDAVARINASALDRVAVTNTVPPPAEEACEKLEVLDVSGLFAEAIRRVHHGESLGMLFQYD
ncbi:hypothetical protein VTK26DRAFT_851 [Humicola hyalothermophila]